MKAAVRVLERDGAQRFTTIRVAEAAGVSVGSLYQYFPNKQSILYQLQVEEWARTTETVDAILGDETLAAPQRLRRLMRAFFQSECDEAPLRLALDTVAPTYRPPASRAKQRRSKAIVKAFMIAIAPRASAAQRRFGAELLFATMTSVGKQVSERTPKPREMNRWADAVSEMLAMYFARLGVSPDRAL
jgi:AcrR family transcriptional regulator